MKQFFQFIVNHWILWSLLAVALILLFIEEIRGRVMGILPVTPEELTKMINREDAKVVDVRDGDAFSVGHIINSINIPHTLIDANMNKLDQYKDKPLVLVCSNGQTSPQEAAKLHKKGFEKIYFLKGGLLAWQKASLPLTRS